MCGSPLNSDDDLLDDEDDDHGNGEPGEGKHFETQDTIVCQWEKVCTERERECVCERVWDI